jgi:hypothetical protein
MDQPNNRARTKMAQAMYFAPSCPRRPRRERKALQAYYRIRIGVSSRRSVFGAQCLEGHGRRRDGSHDTRGNLGGHIAGHVRDGAFAAQPRRKGHRRVIVAARDVPAAIPITISADPMASGETLPASGLMTHIPTVKTKKKVPINSTTHLFMFCVYLDFSARRPGEVQRPRSRAPSLCWHIKALLARRKVTSAEYGPSRP